MIHVTRSAPPQILLSQTETLKAIAFYAALKTAKRKSKTPKDFEFKDYKHDTVKQALELMFNGKCAYCESKYGASSPMDVEHYRPKGEVKSNGIPVVSLPNGYYWLAASWDNLLPSCPRCNRPEYHAVIQGPGQPTTKRISGKRTEFPLADENRRACTIGDEVNEAPLLLNPCLDQPEEHLQFCVEADLASPKKFVSLVKTATFQNQLSQRGETTITVLGLDRRDLVGDRSTYLSRLLDSFDDKFNAPLEDPGDFIADPAKHSRFCEKLTGFVQDYLGPEAEYAGMARQIFAQRMIELIKTLSSKSAGNAEAGVALGLVITALKDLRQLPYINIDRIMQDSFA